MENKRLIDMTSTELIELVRNEFKTAVDSAVNQIMNERTEREYMDSALSIHKLHKLKLVGGRDRIKSLIEQGILPLTADGRIAYSSVQKYIKSQADEKEKEAV